MVFIRKSNDNVIEILQTIKIYKDFEDFILNNHIYKYKKKTIPWSLLFASFGAPGTSGCKGVTLVVTGSGRATRTSGAKGVARRSVAREVGLRDVWVEVEASRLVRTGPTSTGSSVIRFNRP